MIRATLAPNSPLLQAFTEGSIPLARATTVDATLGDEKAPQSVWLLDLTQCSLLQLAVMAQLMHEAGQGTREELWAHLTSEKVLPIRTFNVTAVTADARSFL